MPISVEPKISQMDKEKLQTHIKKIRKILAKYPSATGFSHMITSMERAKSGASELEKWIECLSVGEGVNV